MTDLDPSALSTPAVVTHDLSLPCVMHVQIVDASALHAAAGIVAFGLVITSEHVLRQLVLWRVHTQDSTASQQVLLHTCSNC